VLPKCQLLAELGQNQAGQAVRPKDSAAEEKLGNLSNFHFFEGIWAKEGNYLSLCEQEKYNFLGTSYN
jgi:hypothetical protein